MANLIEILLGVGASLIAAEVVAYAPSITNWLITKAVRQLPEADQARFSEEWQAHACELPGGIAKLRHGLACYLRAARTIARARSSKPHIAVLHIRAAYITVLFYTRFSRLLVPVVLKLLLHGYPRGAAVFLRCNSLIVNTLIRESVYGGKSLEVGVAEAKKVAAKLMKLIDDIAKD